jgi:hypothetical protein
MNKFCRLLLALLVVVIIFAGIISPAYADDKITIINNSTEIHFPGALVFKIQANSYSQIVNIRLKYIVDRVNFAPVVSESWPDFVPSTSVNTQWTWDTRKSSLPPGAKIQYWWQLKNQDGDSTTTEVKTVFFNDNSHSWKELKSGNITILWYEGDEEFATKLITSATNSLSKLTEDTGASLTEPIRIFIYANSEDLQQSMIAPREWTGGISFTEYSIIAIGIEPGDIEWGENALAHELGHAAVHQITFSPYSVNLPTWLDEGLAQYTEITKNDYLELLLRKAVENNALISLRSLCSPFSAIPQQAYLSYAESLSIVEYLIQEYGRDQILSLLKTFKEGSTYDNALQKAYGIDINKLESQWKVFVNKKYALQRQHTPLKITVNQDYYQRVFNHPGALLISGLPVLIP